MPEHGGRLRRAAEKHGIPLADWLDLSTGIAPWSWVLPEIPASAWLRLPEDDDGLEQAARLYYGTEHLLPLPGSQAAIQRVFYRGERTAAEGSGIGLAIARELAERMGGTIELRSEPGSTTFTLTLPRAEAPAPFPRENAAVV